MAKIESDLIPKLDSSILGELTANQVAQIGDLSGNLDLSIVDNSHTVVSPPGAFLVPYFTILVFGAVPMFFLELVLGQYHRKGAVTVWQIAPIFKGKPWDSPNAVWPSFVTSPLKIDQVKGYLDYCIVRFYIHLDLVGFGLYLAC